MELISIIMPAYNTVDYIETSIKSVLNQTYHNIELIIINDGSTDGTEKKILSIKKDDNRIKYFNIPNSGSAVARNVGLENAEGKYISFIDSDDYIDKNMIEILNEKMMEYNCDIVSCSFKKIYPNKTVREETYLEKGYYNKKRMEKEIYPFMIATDSLENYIIPKTMVTKLFKKKMIDKNDLRFIPNMRMGQDLEFTKRCFLYANSFYYLPNLMLYNYVHNTSSRTQTYLNNGWKILKESIEQSYRISNQFPEYNLKDQIPYALISNAMTAIANVSRAGNLRSTSEKISELKQIIYDTDLQNALSNINTNKFNFKRKLLAKLMKSKRIGLIYIAVFFRQLLYT